VADNVQTAASASSAAPSSHWFPVVLLAWLIPGELAVFKLDEFERAKQWAAG